MGYLFHKKKVKTLTAWAWDHSLSEHYAPKTNITNQTRITLEVEHNLPTT